jgi:hypothetical protein
MLLVLRCCCFRFVFQVKVMFRKRWCLPGLMLGFMLSCSARGEFRR